jgi:hypothetical protein
MYLKFLCGFSLLLSVVGVGAASSGPSAYSGKVGESSSRGKLVGADELPADTSNQERDVALGERVAAARAVWNLDPRGRWLSLQPGHQDDLSVFNLGGRVYVTSRPSAFAAPLVPGDSPRLFSEGIFRPADYLSWSKEDLAALYPSPIGPADYLSRPEKDLAEFGPSLIDAEIKKELDRRRRENWARVFGECSEDQKLLSLVVDNNELFVAWRGDLGRVSNAVRCLSRDGVCVAPFVPDSPWSCSHSLKGLWNLVTRLEVGIDALRHLSFMLSPHLFVGPPAVTGVDRRRPAFGAWYLAKSVRRLFPGIPVLADDDSSFGPGPLGPDVQPETLRTLRPLNEVLDRLQGALAPLKAALAQQVPGEGIGFPYSLVPLSSFRPTPPFGPEGQALILLDGPMSLQPLNLSHVVLFLPGSDRSVLTDAWAPWLRTVCRIPGSSSFRRILCVLKGECCICRLDNDSVVVKDFSLDVRRLTTAPGVTTRSGGSVPASASRLSDVASALDLLLFVCERIGPRNSEYGALGRLYSKLVVAITPVLDSLLPRVRDGLLERSRPGLRRSSHDDVVGFPDFRSAAVHEAIAARRLDSSQEVVAARFHQLPPD